MIYYIWRIIHFLSRRIILFDEKLNQKSELAALKTARKQLAIRRKNETFCSKDNKNPLKSNIICHAGGGIYGQKYLNSLENFNYYYLRGCRLNMT